MQYIQFDQSKPYDLILLGRVADAALDWITIAR